MAAAEEKTRKIAIVTGASSGIGAEFALQIEKKFFLDEIWLVARRPGPMKELAEKFLKARAVVLPLDLTSRADLTAFERRLAEEKPEVQLLVNNAGAGKYGPFAELGLDEQVKMVDLNVTSVVWLSRVVLPYMKPGAAQIHVASAAAFSPSPYFSVYAATKSFVVSFSDAVGYELREHGIHSIAVCPGPVETEFFAAAQKNDFMRDRVGEAEPANRALFVSPRDVVAQALRDLEKGRRHSVFSLPIRLFSRFAAFIPLSLRLRVLARKNLRK